MLELNKPRPEIGYELSAPQVRSGAEAFHDFMNFARRQIVLIIFVAVISMSFGLIYLATARPIYTAHAQLLIDAHKVQVFKQQSILGDLPLDTAQVESQVQVLKSENVAAAVIKNLHLKEDPEFVGSSGGFLGAIFHFFGTWGSEQTQAASDYELS